jgi:pimeloyl-ACP methyl ester carboxylesterase
MINIQFSHANGFPSESYTCFFKHLNVDKLNYIPAFGLNDYKVDKNWKPLVDELIESIETNFTEPIVGLGHSLGGFLTYLAAQKRPDLFSKIIILDPPFFRPIKRLVIESLVKTNLLEKFPHPANKTKYRRTEFKSEEEAFNYFKDKALFKGSKPECLSNYVNAGLVAKSDGLILKIPRELEYRLFITMPFIFPTKKLKIPSHFIYSNRYEVMQPKDMKWVKRAMPFFNFIEMDGSHLFPFEKPEELAEMINKLI